MQSLNKSVFGPFKTYFDHAAKKTITLVYIGKLLDIYDITDLVRKPSRIHTPKNISNGFKATGFHPLNNDIFSKANYASEFLSPSNVFRNLLTIHFPFAQKNLLHMLKKYQYKMIVRSLKKLLPTFIISLQKPRRSLLLELSPSNISSTPKSYITKNNTCS
ncbi:hypothetical protein EVAR_68635_1 [Eumeta japonica]|uniref:Uncharacterized protein n=1 Tax=Eumeta variegata TaxID=151549 RepID=A0A4C1ZU14_EUMVA|nr:hypothetical protein EVAR_68635_1 [Eumeta japonica]